MMDFSTIPWVARLTPSGGGGGSLSIVQAPAPSEQPFGTSVTRSMSAVGSGNALVAALISSTSGGAPSSIVDSTGTPLSLVSSFTTGTNTGSSFRFYTLANITDAPTSVTASWGGAVEAALLVVEVSGAGSSITLDASGGVSQSSANPYDFSFTSSANNTLFVGAAVFSNSTTSTGVAPVTSTDVFGGFGFMAQGLFSTAGANTATVNLGASRTGDKAFVVLRAGS